MAWWLFQDLVITAALAAVVAVICRAPRIGPVARHALWVVVLVKFVTPPLVVWPWAAPDPFGVATIDLHADLRRPAFARSDQAAITAGARSGHPRLVAAAEIVETPPLVDEGPSSIPFDRVSVFGWLLWVWAIGSLAVLIVEGARLACVARRVNIAGPPDPFIANRVVELSARLKLRPVPVVTIAGIASPMVWCLGRPRLLWPADLSAPFSDDRPRESSDSSIDGVIVHELAHVKRGDHLVGWLELVAGIVWWWNPLFWFVRSSLREQAELACDAWVISALPDGRRAYAEALLALSAAAVPGTVSRSMALIGIRPGSRRALERRLVMIMKGRAPLRLSKAGLLALALIAAATLPAWATGSSQQAPPPPAVPVVQPKPSPQETPTPPLPPAVEVQVKPVKPELPPPPPPPPPKPVPQPTRNRQLTIAGVPVPARQGVVWIVDESNLPADGRQLLEGFDNERKAIRAEADRRIDERREALVKALQNLQEQYTKAGKLDEAVAIRDYLRAGGPGRNEVIEELWRRR
jgi:beta-lactamase regulating signal transducer with metallopeptidase domain